ncbi:hypothetical protein B0H66DRAFT_13195 [Apodospora peruviana]|uniref:Uncharacterized protein n=1 Tax=Apodospora peruviana TaxID=516989 RepID=A0AAE0ME05_9PEZI|nr:hypothetical protein B0H66DRAFT_13195 [Apodospora peruviana]
MRQCPRPSRVGFATATALQLQLSTFYLMYVQYNSTIMYSTISSMRTTLVCTRISFHWPWILGVSTPQPRPPDQNTHGKGKSSTQASKVNHGAPQCHPTSDFYRVRLLSSPRHAAQVQLPACLSSRLLPLLCMHHFHSPHHDSVFSLPPSK